MKDSSFVYNKVRSINSANIKSSGLFISDASGADANSSHPALQKNNYTHMQTMDDRDDRNSPGLLNQFSASSNLSIISAALFSAIIFSYTGNIEIFGAVNQICEKFLFNKGLNTSTKVSYFINTKEWQVLKEAFDFIGHTVIKRYIRIGTALTFGSVTGAILNSFGPIMLSSLTCAFILFNSITDYKNYLMIIDYMAVLEKTGKLRTQIFKLDKLIEGLNIDRDTANILRTYINYSSGIEKEEKLTTPLSHKLVPNPYIRNLPFTLFSNFLESCGIIFASYPFGISLAFIGVSSENKFRTEFQMIKTRVKKTIAYDLENSGLKGKKFRSIKYLDIAIEKQIYFYEKVLQEKEYFESASPLESRSFAKVLIKNAQVKYKNNQRRIDQEMKEEWNKKNIWDKFISFFLGDRAKKPLEYNTKYIQVWNYSSRIYDIERLNKQIRASRFKLSHDFYS